MNEKYKCKNCKLVFDVKSRGILTYKGKPLRCPVCGYGKIKEVAR